MKISDCCSGDKAKQTAWFITIVGTFLIMAWLVSLLVSRTAPEPISAKRGEERLKARTEISQTDSVALQNYGWQDQGKGLVRLPVDRAMEMTVSDLYRDPKAGRARLLARVDKATAKAPEKPNQYE